MSGELLGEASGPGCARRLLDEIEQHVERMSSLFDAAASSGETTLIVSHGGPTMSRGAAFGCSMLGG